MASLAYDLPATGFDGRPFERLATYACSGEHGQLTVSLTESDLVAEFGQVPASIKVVISEPDGTAPAGAWLDAPVPGELPRMPADQLARAQAAYEQQHGPGSLQPGP